MLDAGLQFDPVEHVYSYEGARVPGVTSVLARLSNFDGIPAAVLAEAGARGKATHEAIELDIAGVLDETDLHQEISTRLRHFREFRQQMQFIPKATELRVFSKRHRYAGTLDLWGTVRGMPYVIDTKATFQIPPTVGLQLAAYAQALSETMKCGPVRRGVLHLTRKNWQFVPCNRREDLPEFLQQLSTYRPAA